jgi:hypothetical protein
MKQKVWRAIVLLLFISGCSTVPFQKTEFVPLDIGDPWSIVERFEKRAPDSFQLLTTVVFEYNSRTFSGIGAVQVNRTDRIFRVAAMNPMGVKFFELSGDQDNVVTHYAIDDLSQYGDFATVVGNDIRRIYMDLLPGADANVRAKSNKLIFRRSSGPGFVEHVFAGTGGDLIEKSYYEEDGIVWKVSYYEYRDQNGKRWPRGIVFIHFDRGYRLVVRQKELHS